MLWNSTRISGIFAVLLGALAMTGLSGCGLLDSAPEAEQIAHAQAALDRNDHQAAVVMLKSLLQANPDNRMARWVLGKAYIGYGDGASAEKELQRARGTEIADDVLAPDLATAYYMQGEFAKVVAMNWPLNAGKDVQASFAAVLADAHISLGDHTQAEASISRGEQIHPGTLQLQAALGRLRLAQNRYEDARQVLEDLTKTHPDFGRGWSLLGDLYQSQGQMEKAIEYFGKAIGTRFYDYSDLVKQTQLYIQLKQLDAAQRNLDNLKKRAPKDYNVWYLQGLADVANERYDAAITALTEVIKYTPDNALANYYLGVAHMKLGNGDLAAHHLERAAALQPRLLPARRMLGIFMYQRNDLRRTIEMLGPVVRQRPDDVDAVSVLAAALLQQKRSAEAIVMLRNVVEKVPDSAMARFRLGAALLVSGQASEALTWMRAAMEIEPTLAGAHALLVEQASKDVVFRDEGIALLLGLVEQNPTLVMLRNYLGALYRLKGDLESARAAYRAALALSPHDRTAKSNLAAMALQQNDTAEAERLYREMLDAQAGDAHALMQLAQIAAKRGDLAGVKTLLQRAVDANPHSLEPRLAVARLALSEGQYDKAVDTLAVVKDKNLENAELFALLGAAEMAQGATGRAVATLERAVQLAPQSDNAAYLLAKAYAIVGDERRFNEFLTRSLELNSNNFSATLAMARLKLLQNDLAAVQTYLDTAKRLAPEDAEVLAIEAELAAQQGSDATALRKRQQAFAAEPTAARMSALAHQQWRQGDRQGVLEMQRDWLAGHPDDLTVRLLLANNYLLLEREQEAIAEYRRVLDQDSNNVIALNNLAWLSRQTDMSGAIGFAERAYHIDSASINVMDTLASLYLQAGKAEEALRMAERVLAVKPEDQTAQFRVAQGMLAVGDRAGAELLLKSALQRPTDFPERAQAETLLRGLL